MHNSQKNENIEIFYRRMCEADSYLTLLTEKKKNLIKRIHDITSTTLIALERRKIFENLIKKIDVFIESTTTCIILLQISKQNVVCPRESFIPLSNLNIAGYESYSNSNDNVAGSVHSFNVSSASSNSNSITPETEENQEEIKINDHGSYHSMQHSLCSTEDEFFDAIDHITSNSEDGKPDEDETDDDFYEFIFNLPRNNEDAEDIYHKNGFLITHLLSQVRIGMDLSRILLPTFILENRSLLEMYADFLAHTDFFISIAQQKSPQDRMIAVLKWYVSSFHTAWDVKTAKKPYNPILGEFFECSYKCDETTKSDQVYFISEQISHHPPVSAFYAESCENHIYIEGHIWTKSKFYGLSVGVDLIGGATIYLKEFNEHYKISFPSAFAKSILTVPTVEIGGDVKIVCQETNYKSKISFHLKPFYGGSRHRVSAKISNMTTNKSFYILDGYWNSVFSGKRVHLNTNHFVFDTKNCTTHKKIIKKVSQQKPNESRNLWKNVTKALYRNDIALATQHKFGLEQIQREEASYRKTNSIKWFPKYFTKEADGWVSYINKMS